MQGEITPSLESSGVFPRSSGKSMWVFKWGRPQVQGWAGQGWSPDAGTPGPSSCSSHSTTLLWPKPICSYAPIQHVCCPSFERSPQISFLGVIFLLWLSFLLPPRVDDPKWKESRAPSFQQWGLAPLHVACHQESCKIPSLTGLSLFSISY